MEENLNNQLTKKQEYHKNYLKQYNKTPMGRSLYLIQSYRQADAYYNREQPDFNAKWFMNHVMTSQCAYCGETNWRELGADRIDNSKGHTKDNIICSCQKCNRERGRKPFAEFWRKKQEDLIN